MKRAFTLIELLVVIAIIAILAAILFPVFAQAKVAAKKTAVLSNAKQFGTSQMLYMGDSDDLFSPAMSINAEWQMTSWSVLCQPYIKSYAMLMDPFTPAKLSDTPMVLQGQWGMPTRRAASDQCPTDPNVLTSCAVGNTTEGARQITGGEKWGRDGVAGVNKTADAGMWSGWGYRTGGIPSLSSTAVARPADTLLITQAGTPDLMWHQNQNPDQSGRYWGAPEYNTFGDNNFTSGPMGRVGTNGQKAGIYPITVWSPTVFPEGINVSVYTDGHAKAEAWKAMHSKTVTNGTVKYLRYASPEIP